MGSNSFKNIFAFLVRCENREYIYQRSSYFPFGVEAFQMLLGLQKDKWEVTKVSAHVKRHPKLVCVLIPWKVLIEECPSFGKFLASVE